MTTATNVSPLPRRGPQWTFADRARKVRRDMKLGQAQMADLLGVGLKAYSAWESGKNSPDDIVATSVKFEQVSGVHRTWFLGWIEDEPTTPAGQGEESQQITERSLATVTELRPRTAAVEHDQEATVTHLSAVR